MHLGNARTALLTWLDVRSRGGQMVLRIEDNDPTRSRPAFEVEILRDLAWLGLDWDEGPDVGGPCGPYRQSQRTDLYMAALARIEHYPCTCTRAELRALPRGGATGEPVYPGTCRRQVSRPGHPPAWRWRVPDDAVTFDDRVAGSYTQAVAHEVGDFLVRRADGAFAYQLAVVVDDAAMAITAVVRGMDLLDSTPRQILLQQQLGWPTPTYAHVPLILGPGGAKLSKRDGAPDIASLRQAGVRPGRVIAALAQSLGLVGSDVDEVSAAALCRDFAIETLPPDQPLQLSRLGG